MDLEPIKKRLEAATPGRWLVSEELDSLGYPERTIVMSELYNDYVTTAYTPEDASFIANAKHDVASLISKVEKQKALLDFVSSWSHSMEYGELFDEVAFAVSQLNLLQKAVIAQRDYCDCDFTQLESPGRQCDPCKNLYRLVENVKE